MRNLCVGKWNVRCANAAMTENMLLAEQGLEAIDQWLGVFPKEKTWVQQAYGVPSLVLKIDYHAHDGKMRICEIEDRPDGIGVVSMINSEFSSNLSCLKRKWPKFVSVVSEHRETCDDHLWLGNEKRIADIIDSDELILPRCEPSESQFHALQSRCVSPIVTEGSKCYGEALGWWSRVSYDSLDAWDWSEGWVIKPLQGSKSQHVRVYLPNRKQLQKNGFDGIASVTAIEKKLKERTVMYRQQFFDPARMHVDADQYLLLKRLYFGFDPEIMRYVPLGGQVIASKNFVIHGGEKSIVFPLVLEGNRHMFSA